MHTEFLFATVPRFATTECSSRATPSSHPRFPPRSSITASAQMRRTPSELRRQKRFRAINLSLVLSSSFESIATKRRDDGKYICCKRDRVQRKIISAYATTNEEYASRVMNRNTACCLGCTAVDIDWCSTVRAMHRSRTE